MSVAIEQLRSGIPSVAGWGKLEYTDWIDESESWKKGCYLGEWSFLLGAIGTVAGVAEPWQDVGVGVQPFVDRGEPNRNVRVNAAHAFDTFRHADKAYQSYVVRAALFQPVDRGDGGVRRCQHRRDHNHQPLVQIAGRLEEIFDRNECFRFAVKADVSDPCRRHQIEHA